MGSWSPEVANAFILLAHEDGRHFDQMQLQHLVYLAHGWLLAETGAPLTLDRPEARLYGPEYRRLAEALAHAGAAPVACCIALDDHSSTAPSGAAVAQADDVTARVYHEYGHLSASHLALLTSSVRAPWERVYAHGAGPNQEIPNALIRTQFEALAVERATTEPLNR